MSPVLFSTSQVTFHFVSQLFVLFHFFFTLLIIFLFIYLFIYLFIILLIYIFILNVPSGLKTVCMFRALRSKASSEWEPSCSSHQYGSGSHPTTYVGWVCCWFWVCEFDQWSRVQSRGRGCNVVVAGLKSRSRVQSRDGGSNVEVEVPKLRWGKFFAWILS